MKAIKNADGQVIGYIPDELPPAEFGKRVPQEGDTVTLRGWDKPYKVGKIENGKLYVWHDGKVVDFGYDLASHDWIFKD